jgi:hypothetical protein
VDALAAVGLNVDTMRLRDGSVGGAQVGVNMREAASVALKGFMVLFAEDARL